MKDICISVITWNNLEYSKILFSSIEKELKSMGIMPKIFVSDNGSTDGTVEYLSSLCFSEFDITYLGENVGISRAKNISIRKARNGKFKYMFMFDNDVAVLPGSLSYMISYMENNEKTGCFGQHIDHYTRDLQDPILFDIDYSKANILSCVKSGYGSVRAWTHYSLYRTSVFDDGVEFDESGPFGKAGYGFDDDDLGQQIFEKGYKIDCFSGIKCYHNVNSSVNLLKENSGLNFDQRCSYFKNKWNL